MSNSSASRVALRYAASRPMKPEKMQALLLKIRKGAGSSLKTTDLLQVLDYLGGWKIEEALTLKAEHYEHVDPPEKKYFWNSNKATIESMWQDAKANEYQTLPEDNLHKYRTYYQDVSPIVENKGQYSFQAFAWQAIPGVKVVAPNHKSFQIAKSYDLFLRSYAAEDGLQKWLKTETPFLRQIDEKLGMESLEEEKLKKVRENLKNRTTDNMGTCPCCFGTFKLVPRSRHGHDKSRPGMVLHGYKRPGTGTVYGNCFGQDWPPFELSREGTDAFVHDLGLKLKEAEEYFKDLKAGQVFVLQDQRGKSYGPGEKNWEAVLHRAIMQSEALVGRIETMITTCKRQLASWEPTGLPEVGSPLKLPR